MNSNCEYENNLRNEYKDYVKNLQKIYPGSKFISEAYCKAIALIQNDNPFLKSPDVQTEFIQQITSLFKNVDEPPRMMQLYPDILQHNQMKDLEFRNSPEIVKEELVNFFIQKFFRLCNLREKILAKSNNILNFKDFSEKFIVNKDYKLSKINSELDFTLRRIIRLMNAEDDRSKDFEYYLKHFKVRKIDALFLKQEQTEMHYNLRKDDFEVYFREKCYYDRLSTQIRSFEPYVKFAVINKGFEIWKESKQFLSSIFKKCYESKIKSIKNIYSNEKSKSDQSEWKSFKEYFKMKYKFYYTLKEKNDNDKTKHFESFNYDIFFPPLLISLNSEIRPYLKELCDYFSIPFDITMDKGKAFSYAIDIFYPKHFREQSKYYSYNSYDLTFNEISSGIEKTMESGDDVMIETKATEVLRNKYSIAEGFLVSGENKIFAEKLKHFSFKSDIYIKKAHWAKFLCIYPQIDQKYFALQKRLDEVGYIDSILKYELELIEVVDLQTLNRIIEENTNNISSRIKNTIKLIASKKEESEYSKLRNIVREIIERDDIQKRGSSISPSRPPGMIMSITNANDEYASKVDGDLLKYLLIMRFLKLRDYKCCILNLLNYFRYIQKKFAIDMYKIENKHWKKNEDVNHLTGTLSGTMKVKNTEDKKTNKHNLISSTPLSEFTKTNPTIPSLEHLLESKKEFLEFNRILLDEIDETVEYSEKLIRVKDNKGNYIIYDATLSDMKQLENEFCKIGTYYIQKKEQLVVDTEKVPNPFIDRTQVIMDLFINEYDFLNAKFEVISELMTCYDNTTDIFIQKYLMQTITDILAQRPLLDLNFHYFSGSYLIEIESLRKRAAFLTILIDYQKKLEINENRQLYDSIEKFYWMLGETALELIQHVRLDKSDIEALKQVISMKKQRRDDVSSEEEEKNIKEIEELIDLFARLKQEKEMDQLIDLHFDEKPGERKEILVFNQSSDHGRTDQVEVPLPGDVIEPENKEDKNILDDIQDTSKHEKLLQRLSVFMAFMKKLFNRALTGCEDDFIENSTESLIKSEEAVETIKDMLNLSLPQIGENAKPKRKNYVVGNRSYSISNTSLDLMNYQIRSLLNIPNPFLENRHLNFIEKNPTVVNTLEKDINFTKLEEGFPHKFVEHEDINSKQSNELEFFESLKSILLILSGIDNCMKDFESYFTFENDIARKGLQVCLFDYLIDQWDKYKDYISGRKKTSEFEQLYFLQNTVFDDYQSLMYTIKSLKATLSNSKTRIPPHLLVKLPYGSIDHKEMENIEFNIIDTPKDPSVLENFMLHELQASLMKTLTQDLNAGWLKIANDFSEVKLYCNMMEAYRTKQSIFDLIMNNTLLTMIYQEQKESTLNRHDDMLSYKENVGLIPPTEKDFLSGPNSVDYPITSIQSNATVKMPKFSMDEFDPTLTNCINLQDLLTCQINLLDSGINELKTFAQYEYMNFFLLLIGTQHNHNILFEPNKYIAELDLFENSRILTFNGIFDPTPLINQPDNAPLSLSLYENRTKVKAISTKLGKEFFYSIIDRKFKNRNNIFVKYNIFIEEKIRYLVKPLTVKRILARHYRILLANAYAKDIMLETFLDGIKLQACKAARHLKRLYRLIPKEYGFFEVNDCNFIENELRLANASMVNKNFIYFHDRSKPFTHFYIPSDAEILRLENQTEGDIAFHYSSYNPFSFKDDITNSIFFSQLKENFFKAPGYVNKFADVCIIYSICYT